MRGDRDEDMDGGIFDRARWGISGQWGRCKIESRKDSL